MRAQNCPKFPNLTEWAKYYDNVRINLNGRRTRYPPAHFKIIGAKYVALQSRHKERDRVSNHQILDCLLNHLFMRRSKKTSNLCVTGRCEGNPPVIGGFPSQRPVTRKTFPFDDVIMEGLLAVNISTCPAAIHVGDSVTRATSPLFSLLALCSCHVLEPQYPKQYWSTSMWWSPCACMIIPWYSVFLRSGANITVY